MTKSEKTARRYVLRELRLNPLVRDIMIVNKRTERDIAVYLNFDSEKHLAKLLNDSKPYFGNAVFMSSEIRRLAKGPRAKLRNFICVHLFEAILCYEENIGLKLTSKLIDGVFST